jgi:hypothetical protein
MQRASLINRINYETRWLSRPQLVDVGYRAVRELTCLKGEYGYLPRSVVKNVTRKIDDALEFGAAVHAADGIADPQARRTELARLGPDIRRRNHEVFFSGVANQAFPINRSIGGRWFDETLHDASVLEAASAGSGGSSAAQTTGTAR